MKGLPEATARKYFRQIVVAVDYCHSQGVVHRFVISPAFSPVNCFLTYLMGFATAFQRPETGQYTSVKIGHLSTD